MIAAPMNIGPMDVFCVFMMLVSLQLGLNKRMLEASRRRLAANIERKRG